MASGSKPVHAMDPLRSGRGTSAKAAAGLDDGVAMDGIGSDLEMQLREADLVICRTGCLSHGAYWRIQDYCRRKGTTCIAIDEGQPIQLLRRADMADDADVGFAPMVGSVP
jgi:hypothetical protein